MGRSGIDIRYIALSGTNQGSGVSVFKNLNPVNTLNFKTLVAGSNITITPSANEITIAGTGGTLTGATNGLSLISGGTKVALGGTLIENTTINGTNNSLSIDLDGTYPMYFNLDSSYGIESYVDGSFGEVWQTLRSNKYEILRLGQFDQDSTIRLDDNTLKLLWQSGSGGSDSQTQIDMGFNGFYLNYFDITSHNKSAKFFIDNFGSTTEVYNDAAASSLLAKFVIGTGATTYTDGRGTKTGIQYAANYASGFTSRSLVDKAYVDSVTGSVSGTTNYVPRFVTSTTLGNSQIFDSGGTTVSIGNISTLLSGLKFSVLGGLNSNVVYASTNGTALQMIPFGSGSVNQPISTSTKYTRLSAFESDRFTISCTTGSTSGSDVGRGIHISRSGGVSIGNFSTLPPTTTLGRLDCANDVVAFSSSDIRLKENVKSIPNPLNKVLLLTGIEFDWKKELIEAHGYDQHDYGVIAQEVKEVLPEAVRTNDTGYLAVRYEKLIPLLIEAIKEQQKEINELKEFLKKK